MSGLKRHLAASVFVVAALTTIGCGPLLLAGAAGAAAGVGAYAEVTNRTVEDHDWRSHTPAEGWTRVAQTSVSYGPNPVQAAVGQATMSPFGLSSTDVH